MSIGGFRERTETCEHCKLSATYFNEYVKIQLEDKGYKTEGKQKYWPVTCYKNLPTITFTKFNIKKKL